MMNLQLLLFCVDRRKARRGERTRRTSLAGHFFEVDLRLESTDPARERVALEVRPSFSAFPALDATDLDVLTEFFAMCFTSFLSERGQDKGERSMGQEPRGNHSRREILLSMQKGNRKARRNKMSYISVLLKRPGQIPRHVNVSNRLEALQKNVDGRIETLTIAKDLVVICNEEGKEIGLPYNCRICGVDFVGTILMAGVKGDEFDDLPATWKEMKEMFPRLWEEPAGGGGTVTEYRTKKLQKLTNKIGALIDELELLLDAELRHIDEYQACEDLCLNMSDADKQLRLAMYSMQQAEACAEMGDMQTDMQQKIEQMTG